MDRKLISDPQKCYNDAEQQAMDYFQLLYDHLKNMSYSNALVADFNEWKPKHLQTPLQTFLSRTVKKQSSNRYHSYIQSLHRKGKLYHYLHRSVSYIYMRDLGKNLALPKSQQRIAHIVESLQKQLIDGENSYSIYWLYRLAQREGVETTLIWIINKLKHVSTNIHKAMDKEQAKRKLIKMIAGVVMHVLEEMDDELAPEERAHQLDVAIRLGYCYGLTYPFIDDLLDAKILTSIEEEHYSNMIRRTLTTGIVPQLGEWSGPNKKFISFIHGELKEAFEYMKSKQKQDSRKFFFEKAYVFFQAQEVDRKKSLFHTSYSNEQIYVPVILKAAFSRLILRSVISAPEDEQFHRHIFYYGIYNQLADDFTDMEEDLKAGIVTPYTYFLKNEENREDLINPFELYWTVIYYLIHHVYENDTNTRDVILERAINGLKRLKARVGTIKYNEILRLFTTKSQKLNEVIQMMVNKANNVDFFDKLLRDHMIRQLKKEKVEKEEFFKLIKDVRLEINQFVPIEKGDNNWLSEPIIEAANYSLEGDGKRIRPIITSIMGIKYFQLNKEAIVPLLKSLEYMHTASLIFDDLPSQDNAMLRRGKLTLHSVYNDAIAELTGLFLTQKAIEEQASLKQFDSATVLKLIHYSANVTGLMCRGQAMDLQVKGKDLTIDQLNTMCFYKTGIAFEACLIMPAILANVDEQRMEALATFAKHAGVAFQIKDDLLDLKGDPTIMGKPVGLDTLNKSTNFVTILGEEGACKMMWEHYCLAMETWQSRLIEYGFLKHLLNYFVHREQ